MDELHISNEDRIQHEVLLDRHDRAIPELAVAIRTLTQLVEAQDKRLDKHDIELEARGREFANISRLMWAMLTVMLGALAANLFIFSRLIEDVPR